MSEVNKIKAICKNEYILFIKKANVIGITLGEKIIAGRNTKEKCIQVLVNKKVSEMDLSEQDIIPKKYRDIKTDVIEVGEIKANI